MEKTPETVWKVEITGGVFWMFSSEKDAQQFASLDKAAKMERLLITDYKGSTNVMEIQEQPIP